MSELEFAVEMQALLDWMEEERIPAPRTETERREIVGRYLAIKAENE